MRTTVRMGRQLSGRAGSPSTQMPIAKAPIARPDECTSHEGKMAKLWAPNPTVEEVAAWLVVAKRPVQENVAPKPDSGRTRESGLA